MICYLDMTFCRSDCINEKCHRNVTDSVREGAEEINLPLALCDFSDDCDLYETDELLIGDCGCRFESHDSNTVLLCEECSKLPCHNP